MAVLTSRATALAWLVTAAALWTASAGPLQANHELLTSLGMVRRRLPPNSHRKRLTSEMRSGGSSNHGHDDSHLVVIKLPPEPYYYTHNKPGRANDISKPTASLSFQGNGKPSGVYHWNLPVINKIKSAHARRAAAGKRHRVDSGADSQIFHIQKDPGPVHHQSHQRNDVLKHDHDHDRGHGHGHGHGHAHDAAHPHDHKSHPSKSRVSYYTPRRKVVFHKYYQGNGKPHSFYVIEKSKKPIHYHRLLP